MKQFSKLSSHDTGRKFVLLGVPLDQFWFLGNCPPTPPLVNINTYFSLRAKCWAREGVGGQFSRNLKVDPFLSHGTT